jgi:hypothetical protein
MRAIKGNIGAAAAEKWNWDEKIAIKPGDRCKTSSHPLNEGPQGFPFVAGARTERRC